MGKFSFKNYAEEAVESRLPEMLKYFGYALLIAGTITTVIGVFSSIITAAAGVSILISGASIFALRWFVVALLINIINASKEEV